MDLNKFSTFNIILGILFIVYSLIMFLLFIPFSPIFGITFAFTIIAFVLLFALSYHFSTKTNESIQFTNFSAFYVACIYLFLQIMVSIVLNIILFNVTFAIIIEVIILAITVIIMLVLLKSIDYIDEVEVKKENQIEFQRNALKSVEVLKQKYPNCKELENLYETVRFSNPMSTIEVNDLEMSITNKLNLLKEYLNKNDKDNSIKLINDITEDFKERDILLKH